MKNIKRILNLILIIFIVLSALMSTKSLAIITDELEATGIPEHFNENLTLQQYRSNYDIFCCMHGVPANDTNDNTISVDGNTYDTNSITQKNEGSKNFWGFKIKTQKIYNSLPSYTTNTGGNFTLRDITYIKNTAKSGTAKPEEAYILAEMEENIYNKNFARDVISFTETGAPETILWSTYSLRYDFSFEITVDEEIIKIVKTKDGKSYKLIKEPQFLDPGEWIEISTTSTDMDFYDDDWSLSSYVQKAWWLIDWVDAQASPNYQHSSGGSKAIKSNQLSDEAKAFQSYIIDIADVTNVNNLTYKEQDYNITEIDESSGSEVIKTGVVEAPNVDYKADWNASALPENAIVSYDIEKKLYKIGPFAIDYHQESYQHSSGREVLFSGISNLDVISNCGKLIKDEDGTLIEGEYAFLHQETGATNSEYPESGKEFYIVTPYKNDLKEIQNIEISFKNMNAGAEFDYYTANGTKETWEVTSYCTKCHNQIKTSADKVFCSVCRKTVCKKCKDACTTCVSGAESTSCSKCNDTVNVYLERKSSVQQTGLNIQAMAHGLKAARWYEEKTISTNKKWDMEEPFKGNLTIVKNVVDDQGNPIYVEEDKTYEFRVTIARANDDGEYKDTSGGYLNSETIPVLVEVPKGSSTGRRTLDIENWRGDKSPLYTVEEVGAGAVEVEGYTYSATKIENGSGSYEPDTIKIVTVTNIYGDTTYYKGKIKIVKNIVDDIKLTREKVFEYDIKISIDGTVVIEDTAKVIVSKGSSSAEWVSNEYIWEKGKTARYEVVEKVTPGYQAETERFEGNLIADNIIPVNYRNKEIINKGYIQINKNLMKDGAVYNTTKDEVFSFEVYINGEYDRDVPVTVLSGNSGAISEKIEYEWPDETPPPICKVIEKKHGDYMLVSIDPEEQQLANGATKEFEVTNKKTETTTDKHGSIQIIKRVDEEVKADTTFEFKVIIDDKVDIEKVHIAKGEREGIWKSEEYEWETTAPTYSVTEINTPSNYKFKSISTDYGSVNNNIASGSLKDSTDPVEVTVENELKEEINKGKIQIVKTLKDKDGNSYSAEKREIFVFDIYKDDVYDRTETVNVEKEESSGKSDEIEYEWRGSTAPKIRIVEKEHEEYELNTIDAGPKDLVKDSIVQFSAENKRIKDKNEATIKLYKKLIGEDEDGNPISVEASENTNFDFRVYVTYSDGKEEKYDVTVTVEQGFSYADEVVKESNDPNAADKVFTWEEGEKPPTFRVEEKTRIEHDPYVSDNEKLPDEWEWKEIAIENDNNVLKAGENVVGCYNTEEITEKYKKGELQIAKKLVYEEIDAHGNPIITEVTGKEFKFEVKVENVIINPETNQVGEWKDTVIIKAGDSWAKEFIWKDGDLTPTYEVTEVDADEYDVTFNHKYQETDYGESTGTKTGNPGNKLKANTTVLVEAINEFKYSNSGTIQIHKDIIIEDKLTAAELGNPTFRFKVTIYYDNPNEYFTYNGEAYNKLELYKNISVSDELNGETEEIATVNFDKAENGPKYVVEEVGIPSGWQLISTEKASGKVVTPGITAKFTNRLPLNRVYDLTMELGGNVWNDTDYSNGKPSDTGYDGIKAEEEDGIGNVKVEVYKNGDTTATYTLLTDCNGKWQIPTLSVPETGKEYYVVYKYDGQTYQATDELKKIEDDGTIVDGNSVNFKTNNTSSETDDDANRKKYLDGSMALEIDRDGFNNEFAEIWGGNPIQDDGITKGYSGDNYPNITNELEYISRDVEYNGYTKKSSELVTVNPDGTPKYEMEASTAKLDLYYPFDRRITLVNVDRQIIEGTPTTSYTYHAAYPYLNNINLGLLERPHADIAIEKDLEEAIVVVNGKIYKYRYGEIANAQFAGLYSDDGTNTPLTDLLYKQIEINQKNINYTLNLYKSDYYYRASVYETDDIVWDALMDKYGNIDALKEDLELDVFLTYKISVTNESDIYDVEVNQISDYVDSSLELVTTDIEKSIDNIQGTEAGKVVVVDAPTKWTWNIQGIEENSGWGTPTEIDDNTLGWRESADVKYDRYTTTVLSGKKIQSGETVSSKVTFKVKDDVTDILDTGIDNCIQLGAKNNIVEIDNYSTYYTDGKVAGRVDEDSAPGNIAIKEKLPESHSKNSINWYEDDTDRAPVLRLGLYEQVRNINGIAWEDSDTHEIEYNQNIGDGLFDDVSEDVIQNMTTKLVEKVTVNRIDYDFIWETGGDGEDIPPDFYKINGKTIYELTGFDSETQTSNETDKEGTYLFEGIPAGNYVVRFIYGDENTIDIDGNDQITDDDKDDLGNIKYSGQDYKSTTYQANQPGLGWNNFANMDGTEYLNNEWHDLEGDLSDELSEARVSDARDDESRRLEVIAKSQNMFYENTSIMDINDSSYGLDLNYADPLLQTPSVTDDPLKTYYMIANTAKLNMNIESVLNSRQAIVDEKTGTDGFFDKDDASKVEGATGVRVHVLNANRKLSNDDSINVKFIKYDVNNIDFGIETRSENNVKLDKQIEQITLKTSAGDILIDANYTIDYDENGVATVELNRATSVGTENLQALNRTTEQLGFRYLNVDKDILQGATITIKYRITALNTGEVDRCNQALINLGDLVNDYKAPDPIYGTNTFEELLIKLRTQEADPETGYEYGQYLGKAYYQGADYIESGTEGVYIKENAVTGVPIDLNDAVVSTKVKQVIDYVDNDVVFSQIENVNQNTSWTNTSTSELETNRYIDSTHEAEDGRTLIENGGDANYDNDKILDSREVAYESDSKNNLIVSIENSNDEPTLANPNLMTAIVPYNSDGYDGPDVDIEADPHSSYINVTVSRYYSSDMDIEEVENIAETLKLYNDVGRRDLKTIQGNTKPALGPATLLPEIRNEHNDLVPNPNYENDSSATELITLSPPTGTVITAMLALQVMAIVLVAITILAGGIAIIKRKVLIK